MSSESKVESIPGLMINPYNYKNHDIIQRILHIVHTNDIEKSASEFISMLTDELHKELSEFKSADEIFNYIGGKIIGRLSKHAKKEVINVILKCQRENFNSFNTEVIATYAIIEYIYAEILELSGNLTHNRIVTCEHIKKAIKDDEELNHLFGSKLEPKKSENIDFKIDCEYKIKELIIEI